MIRTEIEARQMIEKLELDGYTWFPLGGRANNSGIVTMTKDTTAALVERITNSIDAVLEAKYKSEYGDFRNPKDFVKYIADKEGADVFKNKVFVSIHNSKSEETNRPMTIIVEDYGTGIVEDKMTSTILELNGSNKISKRYVMGAYGQGGSTSIKFNRYTVIYSRSDKEVMTIIRFNEGGENDKNGSYEFIGKKLDERITFHKTNVLTHAGTAVSNIAMNYNKIGTLRQQSHSIYNALTNRLFHPPFPIVIQDFRKAFDQMVINGAHVKLDNDIKDPNCKKEGIIKTCAKSTIPFKWWLIMPDNTSNDKSGERYKSYLKDPRLPFNVVVNGQTQGYLSAKLLENSGLSFLKKRLVFEVDLSNITKDERNSIITSTRESLVETSIFRNELEELIESELKKSPRLHQANKKIKEKLVSNAFNSKDFTKNLNHALKKMVSSFARGHVSLDKEISLLEIEDMDSNANTLEEVISLRKFPTFFKIMEKETKEFSGNSLKVRYKTDAPREIIMRHLSVIFEEDIIYEKVTQDNCNGVIHFDASKMSIGESQVIKFDFLDLCDEEILVKKIELHEGNRKKGFPSVELYFIEKENEDLYKVKEFSKDIPMVPEYDKTNYKLLIYINMATFSYIDKKFIEKESVFNNFKNDYALAFAFYLISQIESDDYNPDIKYDYKHLAKQTIHNFQEKLRWIK